MTTQAHITEIDLHNIIDEQGFAPDAAAHLHNHARQLNHFGYAAAVALESKPNFHTLRRTDNCMEWIRVANIARERYGL